MKIDFQQSFTTVQRLINTRAKAAYERAEEKPKLASQDTDFKAQLSDRIGLKPSPLLPPAPALLSPEITPPSLPLETVNSGSLSVKAPTVLSVERIVEKIEADEPRAQLMRPVSFTPDTINGASEASKSATPSSQIIASSLKLADYTSLITDAGIETGVDPALGIAVATAESSLNPNAISADGHRSKGLFQLLDRTGAQLHQQAGGDANGYDPFEPNLNVKLGMNYLRKLHEYFSAPTEIAGVGTTVPAANSSSLEKLAVAAFNAGEGRVTSAQSRAAKQGFDPSRYEQVSAFLPDTTQSYVTKVMNLKSGLSTDAREDDGIS